MAGLDLPHLLSRINAALVEAPGARRAF